ncbi:response regulator [Pontibacter silvestris]|uniref:Response regulator n=1 Tax=Pontibacter silvestris TaxID=2305183 RepID=A0ABW4WV92_9BACT|nr:response regulator transcription factor [Pontibacter silvestris]MCC9138630.1 response regulator transcription factor [Pontibacter silvestris]
MKDMDIGEKIKVIITDDHKIIRDGIKAILSGESSVDIVGEASNSKELLELLETTPADVALLDINMPETGGIETTLELKRRYPNLKVLILTMLDHESYVSKAIENGASGYLLKNAGKEELRSALHLVFHGSTYISPSISLNLLQGVKGGRMSDESYPPHEQRHSLSKREVEVLMLIAEGYTNAEIAERLFNSKRTIETHRQNLLEKTNCKNTASLVKYAVQNRII